MVVFNYTHTFTLHQLNIIITQYLQLGPYFQCLKTVLLNYIARFQSLALIERHNPDKQHPIKLPLNFYKYKNKLSAEIQKDSYNGQFEYVYPLTTVVQVLNSNEFYEHLPKNIIINGLLTTTNINIIIQTLSVLSQELSKLIKNTLESIQEKHLVDYINTLVSDCLQEENINAPQNSSPVPQKKLSFKDLGFLGMLFSKGLNMCADQQKSNKYSNQTSEVQSVNTNSAVNITGVDSDENIPEVILKSKTTSIAMRNSSKKSSILLSLINCPQMKKGNPKNVLRKFRSLITDEKALSSLHKIDDSTHPQDMKNSLDDDFIKKPKEFELCEYCRDMRNYLLESTGFSYFDMQSISRIPTEAFSILKRIKGVTDVFTLYLRQTNRTTIPADINIVNKVLSNINIVITDDLWEDVRINPQFANKYGGFRRNAFIGTGKSTNKNPTLLDELQPYYNQVYNYKNHDGSELTIDELLRICLKAPELKQIEKQLAQKYMNEARVKKEGKDIETFFITRQKLNNKLNIQLQGIQNNGNFSKKSNPFMQSSSQPFVNEIQLLKEYEKQQAIINRAIINCKPIYSQINHNYQQQANIGAQIKRLKNITSNKTSKHIDKSQTLSKINNDAIENEKFKMLIYQQYMRNQGFNLTKNNVSSIINQNMMKVSKSMNFIGKQGDWADFGIKDHIDSNYSQFHPGSTAQTHTSNTLSTANLKTEEDNDISYDKKQTQIYNKMLLNGETVRTQLLNEVEYGDAVIYGSLDDFFNKLDEIATEDEYNMLREQEYQDADDNLFLTMCGPALKKTFSNKRSTPKNQPSIRNSKRCDMQTMGKTLTSKLYKKQSIISVENCKEFKSTNKPNCFKKTLFEGANKTLKQSNIKKQIRFQTITGAQSSFNESYMKAQNYNVELKKPSWVDQHADKGQDSQQIKNSCLKSPITLLQNQRYLAFQEKNFIQECLRAEQRMKSTAQPGSKIRMTSSQINQLQPDQTKSTAQIKRPMSGVINGASKSKMGTVKSLGRTLNGKKRSFMMGKEFVIQNNSLLATIYKQNMTENVFGCVKKMVDQEKVFEEFKTNIERSKFRADKLMA